LRPLIGLVCGMANTTLSDLTPLLTRLAEVRIGVVGDFALDCYWTLAPDAATTSIETGLSTQSVAEQHYSPGAAGNVAVNLRALTCGTVRTFGVVGADPWGRELGRILHTRGADTSGLIEQPEVWSTQTYIKPILNGDEQGRIDFGDLNRLSIDSADRLLDLLAQAIPELDVLVINSQAESGIHTERLRRGLTELIASSERCTFIVDSRDSEGMYPGCALKINDYEAARHCGIATTEESVPRADLLRAAEDLYAERGQPLFITRGAQGILVYDASGAAELPALPCTDEIDSVGAGDAALAAIAAATAAGALPTEAAIMGNVAAAVSVRKLRQTGSATPDEIVSLHRTAGH